MNEKHDSPKTSKIYEHNRKYQRDLCNCLDFNKTSTHGLKSLDSISSEKLCYLIHHRNSQFCFRKGFNNNEYDVGSKLSSLET